MTDFRKYIGEYTDFPKKDVLFWDFTPLLADPAALHQAIVGIRDHFKEQKIDKIAAVESKGFTIGASLAYAMGLPLILIRKPGLIPGQILSEQFVKEYGTGEYQLKEGAIGTGEQVLIIYDIMAGPGASFAAIRLVERSGAKVVGCAYVIELDYLQGRDALAAYDLFSLVKIRDFHDKNHQL